MPRPSGLGSHPELGADAVFSVMIKVEVNNFRFATVGQPPTPRSAVAPAEVALECTQELYTREVTSEEGGRCARNLPLFKTTDNGRTFF